MKKFLVVVISLFIAVSCAKKEEKKAVTGEYVAKVGNVLITEKDIEKEMAALPEERRQFYKDKEGRSRLIEDMVKKEMLSQEAVKKGIDKTDEYSKKLEQIKKMLAIETLLEIEVVKKVEISDKDIKAYYDKHKAEFTDKATGKVIELEQIKEGLKRQMMMERQRDAFDKYMADIKKKYNPEIKTPAGDEQKQNK